jgi:flagellar basal body-associated protein FliL
MQSDTHLIKPHGQKLAIILIVLGILMFMVSYLGDPAFMFKNFWIGFVYQWLMPIGLSIYGIAQAKKANNGFISYKSALGVSAFGLILGTLVVVAFNSLMYNVIDTEFKAVMEEETLQFTYELLEKFGADDAQVEEAIAELERRDSFGVLSQFKGMTLVSVFYLVISLIVAAAMKKDEPVV